MGVWCVYVKWRDKKLIKFIFIFFSSTKTIIQVSLLLLQLLQEPEVIPINSCTQPSGTICETFYNSLEIDCNVCRFAVPPTGYRMYPSFCIHRNRRWDTLRLAKKEPHPLVFVLFIIHFVLQNIFRLDILIQLSSTRTLKIYTQLVDHSKGIHGQPSDQVINDWASCLHWISFVTFLSLSGEDKRIPSIFPAGRVGRKESVERKYWRRFVIYYPLKLTIWFLFVTSVSISLGGRRYGSPSDVPSILPY